MREINRAWVCFVGLTLIAGAAGSPVFGQDIRHRIDITNKKPADALADLGLQTGASIGGPVSCEGAPVTLRGEYTLAQALDRILDNTNCAYQLIDGHTARIRAVVKRQRPLVAAPARRSASSAARESALDVAVADVEVSTTRRPPYAGQFPGAVTVISGDRILNTGVVDTESLSRQAVAFTMTNLGPGRNKILLRGLSDGAFTGRTQSTVGTYLDDVPVTYNAPDPDLRLIDVQDVEILRGPQGALYGSGSISGVYRIITRKPELSRNSASLNILAATTEGGAGSSQLDGVANKVIIPDRLALRVTAYGDRDGGYLHDDNLRLSNVDLTKRSGGRAALLWRLNEAWDATLSTAVRNLSSADTQYVSATGRRANQVRETHANDLSEGALNLRGAGDWGATRATIAFVRHVFSSRYDASSVVAAFGAPGAAVGVFDEGTASRTVVGDAFWSSPEGRQWHFMAGAFASGAVEDLPSELQSRMGSSAPQRLYKEQRRDVRIESALYGEAAYAGGDGWLMVAGLRAFNTTIRTASRVETAQAAAPRLLRASDQYQGLAQSVSIQKAWSVDRAIYIMWSSGFRAGGFNSGGLIAPSPSRATFSPDRLQNIEMGGRYVTDDGRLRINAALFYARWTRLQTDQYLQSGLSYTANVGTGANLGLEGEISWRVGSRWLFQANALVNDPKITHLDPGFSGVAGAQLPGVPKAAFSALITYQRQLSTNRWLLIIPEAAYTGGSHLTFDPRYSPATRGYYTANLTVQLVGEKTRLALLLSNPLNSSVDTFSYGNPFSFGQVRQATPQRPRTLGLRFSRSF